MPVHAERASENANARQSEPQKQAKTNETQEALGMDMRPESAQLLQLQEAANNSAGAKSLSSLQMMADGSTGAQEKDDIPTIAMWNSPEESARAQGNFGKLRGKVVGTMGKVGEEFDKAQGPLNAAAIKMGMPELREDAVKSSFRKRLTGNDKENQSAFEASPETGRVYEVPDVKSRHQLSEAEKGKLADYTDTAKMSEAYQKYAQQHIEKFTASGAHAFIPTWAFGKILNEWKNWGSGTNFVSPLPDANALLNEAKTGGGITHIEKKLGVPFGNWSDKGTIDIIYRFIVVDPKQFKVRLPTGKEGQAYQNEWLSGGKTLGGGNEAVIDAMTLQDLKDSLAAGAIQIKKVTFLRDPLANQVCDYKEEDAAI